MIWFRSYLNCLVVFPTSENVDVHSFISCLTTCNVGDMGSIPELGRSPGEANGCPLQYSGQEHSIHCGPWNSPDHSPDPMEFSRPHGSWNSPDQNTGVGSLFLLQGIFPTQRLNPGLPHCRWILYQLNHKWSSLKYLAEVTWWGLKKHGLMAGRGMNR